MSYLTPLPAPAPGGAFLAPMQSLVKHVRQMARPENSTFGVAWSGMSRRPHAHSGGANRGPFSAWV